MNPLLIEKFLHLAVMKKKKSNYMRMDWQTFFSPETFDSSLSSPISCTISI